MTRLLGAAFTALSLMAWTPVFADSHCTCDENCAQQCQKGKNDKCPCKNCDCAKGEGCKHGKCGHPKHSAEQLGSHSRHKALTSDVASFLLFNAYDDDGYLANEDGHGSNGREYERDHEVQDLPCHCGCADDAHHEHVYACESLPREYEYENAARDREPIFLPP